MGCCFVLLVGCSWAGNWTGCEWTLGSLQPVLLCPLLPPWLGGGGRSSEAHLRPTQPTQPAPSRQANFRFLVSDAVDARRFEADPDRMLEWEDVVQVRMCTI